MRVFLIACVVEIRNKKAQLPDIIEYNIIIFLLFPTFPFRRPTDRKIAKSLNLHNKKPYSLLEGLKKDCHGDLQHGNLRLLSARGRQEA